MLRLTLERGHGESMRIIKIFIFILLIFPVCASAITDDQVADFELDNSQYFSFNTDGGDTVDLAGDVTVFFWIKPQTNYQTQQPFTKYQGGNQSQDGYGIGIVSGGIVRPQFLDNAHNRTRFVTDDYCVVATSTWGYYAMVYDVDVPDIKVYKDGVECPMSSVDTNATAIGQDAGVLAIGALGSPNYYLDGRMEDVRIYDYVLDPWTIINDSDRCDLSDSTSTEPIARWIFEGASTTTFKFDEYPGNIDLTNNNNVGAVADFPYECEVEATSTPTGTSAPGIGVGSVDVEFLFEYGYAWFWFAVYVILFLILMYAVKLIISAFIPT